MLAAGLVLDRVVVRAEHVRIAPGLPPRLQAGPVGLRAYVSQDNVDRWTRTAHLPIRLALTEEGVLLTTGVRGIRMSETLADLEVSGPFLRLAPKRMTIVGLPAPLARFFRGYLPLPPAARRARASPRCARRRRAGRHLRSSTTSTSPSRPTSPGGCARSPACRSPASAEDHPPWRRAAFLRWPAHHSTVRGVQDASPTSRLRARHRDRHHRERARPAGRRRRHRGPGRPRLRRGVHRPARPSCCADLDERLGQLEPGCDRHLERRRLRPALHRRPGRPARAAARPAPPARQRHHHAPRPAPRPPRRLPSQLVRPRPPRRLPPLPGRRRTGAAHLLLAEVDRPLRGARARSRSTARGSTTSPTRPSTPTPPATPAWLASSPSAAGARPPASSTGSPPTRLAHVAAAPRHPGATPSRPSPPRPSAVTPRLPCWPPRDPRIASPTPPSP